ncbi:reverse transcriptase domain-containing protein, partial [Tanacetum coccineum]
MPKNMNSIEQCIIERSSHEQELKMTLKKLSEKTVQIQQCKEVLPADQVLLLNTPWNSHCFVHELKTEMHDDLEYVKSLEKEIDELESEKADFSNIYDLLLEEVLPNTANGCKPKPRNWQASMSSRVSNKDVHLGEHRKQKPFLKFNELQCPTCKKCLYSANHDKCVLEYLSRLNPRASAQNKDAKSHKTTKRYMPVEKSSASKKPERQIPTGHRFSNKKTTTVLEKTMNPRSCLRWKPTGRIFSNVRLRWIPTGKLLNSCTGKVDSEPPCFNSTSFMVKSNKELYTNADALYNEKAVKFKAGSKSCSSSSQDSYITTRVGITIPPSYSNAEDNRQSIPKANWQEFGSIRGRSGDQEPHGTRDNEGYRRNVHDSVRDKHEAESQKMHLRGGGRHVLGIQAEKSLPFFKALKKCTKKSDFQWTAKAEAAFKQMKKLIAELPTLTAPMEKEELIVYLAAARETVSAMLMTKREVKQMLVYFVSRSLQGPEINYTSMEKLALALVHAIKQLKRYFQAHIIIVIMDQPIKQVPRTSVKGQILADFIVERPEDDSLVTTTEAEEELPDPWTLFTDGSSCTDGSRAGMILT